MTPREKYGNEFAAYEATIPVWGTKQGRPARAFAVGILPEKDRESTLAKAWSLVREVAEWLSTGDELAENDECSVIVRWSVKVRPKMELIFRVVGDKSYLAQVARDPKLTVPAPIGWFGLSIRWDRDVWGAMTDENEMTMRSAELNARRRRIKLGLEPPIYLAREGCPRR